jgi:Predicted RNA-binding protein homologous to eukaryotic snRNP
MQLDSLMIYHLTKELNQSLLGAQVREIHQIDSRLFELELFKIDTKPMHFLLSAQTPTYACILFEKRKNSNFIPAQNFCMSLRKHLEGSRIVSIEQMNLDRIIRIEFNRIENNSSIISKFLYCELLPAAPNLILAENNIILDACIYHKKNDRSIVPQQEYQAPKNSLRMNFLDFNEQELLDILVHPLDDKEKTVAEVLFSLFNGLNQIIVSEICQLSHISSADIYHSLSLTTKKILASAIVQIKTRLQNANGLFFYKKANKVQISAISLSIDKEYQKQSVNKWIVDNISNTGGIISTAVKELTKQIQSALKKELRKEKKIREELAETEKTEEYKLWGNLLSINAWKSIPRQFEIEVENLFVDPPTKVQIPLDPTLSLPANSQMYFKKYNKLKKREEIGIQKLRDCLQMQEYFNNLLYFASTITDRKALDELHNELKNNGIKKQSSPKTSLKKVTKKEPFIHTENKDGYIISIGKNNSQNEFLTLHKANKNDIWLHAQKIPGAHVVIHQDNVQEDIPNDIILYAASLAAYYSQDKDSGKVSVDYTKIKYVKKIPQGPLGLVTYSYHKTIVVKPTPHK